MQKAFSLYNWDLAFQNKDINEEIKILIKTVINICKEVLYLILDIM